MTEQFAYHRIDSGVNQGKIDYVELARQVGGGPMVPVQTGLYTYYASHTAFGSPGDLETATMVDGGPTSAATLGTSYYRYQTVTLARSVGGNVVANASAEDVLADAYGPASFARLAAAVWPSASPTSTETTAAVLAVLDGMSTAAVTAAQSPDTANVYEPLAADTAYYTGRVSSRTIPGAGCSSCSGGLGTTTFQFVTNTNANAPATPGYNAWATETIVGVPYGGGAGQVAYEYVYYNGFGQPMLDVQQVVTTISNGQGTSSRYEGTYTGYDAAGEAVFVASPSAVALPAPSTSGTDPWAELDANPDLLDQTNASSTSPTFAYVAAHAGLVMLTSHESAATATGEGPGQDLRRGRPAVPADQLQQQHEPDRGPRRQPDREPVQRPRPVDRAIPGPGRAGRHDRTVADAGRRLLVPRPGKRGERQ